MSSSEVAVSAAEVSPAALASASAASSAAGGSSLGSSVRGLRSGAGLSRVGADDDGGGDDELVAAVGPTFDERGSGVAAASTRSAKMSAPAGDERSGADIRVVRASLPIPETLATMVTS